MLLGSRSVTPRDDKASACPRVVAAQEASGERGIPFYQRRHLQFGWWALLVFVVLGVGLEMLHGFKLPAYLNVSNSTRRLMWTLAHAHGTLIAILNLVFAVCLPLCAAGSKRARDLASIGFLGAGILMPLGFFLGGVHVHRGDPGIGILLVPVGALLLVIAVYTVARASAAGRETRAGKGP